MKILRNTLLVSVVTLILSCQLVLDLDMPKQPSKLVVNSIISSDCVMTVSISKSLDILDSIYYESVSDAIVTVSDDQGLAFNFTPSFDFYNVTYRSKLLPQPGRTYTLKARSQGLEPIESITRFPELIENVEALIDSNNSTNSKLAIQVKFKDNLEQKNYYEAYFIEKTKRTYTYVNNLGQVYTHIDTVWYRSRIYYEYADFLNYKSLFSDIYCNKGCVLNGTTDIYPGPESEVLEAKVEVLNISPDYYEYLTRSHLQGDAYDDPTSQPVQAFNNITNGYGIFAGFSRTYVIIK